jgi:hypothetical protein|tara:strand:- start:458 stop:1039 length:582 start_codon:yes stop_codon:yes gene_type:complete
MAAVDPTTAIAATIVSSLVAADGARKIGKQTKAANDYNAAINDRNALADEQDAIQLKLANGLSIARFQREFSDLQDATSQAFRFNGFVAEGGTPLKVALANAKEADEEIAIMKYNSAVGVQELEQSAVQNKMQGNLNRLYGRNAMAAANINAGTSLLSGFTSAASIQSNANLNRQTIKSNSALQKSNINRKYG